MDFLITGNVKKFKKYGKKKIYFFFFVITVFKTDSGRLVEYTKVMSEVY